MPIENVPRGHTANLGVNVVPGDLHINGVATPYSISIDGAAATPHVAAIGVIDTYHVNGQTVSVTNNTPAPGPNNLILSW